MLMLMACVGDDEPEVRTLVVAGDPVPHFEVVLSDGSAVSSQSLLGSWYVLVFSIHRATIVAVSYHDLSSYTTYVPNCRCCAYPVAKTLLKCRHIGAKTVLRCHTPLSPMPHSITASPQLACRVCI